MTVKMILAAVVIHLGTIVGVLMAGVDRAEVCADSRDLLCGTPLAGLIERDVGVSANPLKFVGSLLTVMNLLRSLTWYGYEVIEESQLTLAIIWENGVKLGFSALRLRLAWLTFGILSNAVSRFR